MGSDTTHRTRSMKDVVRNFAPAWFAVNMGTGSISILFNSYPYGSDMPGMKVMSLIFLLLNIGLFLLFSAISIVRYTTWPDIWFIMSSHPAQSMFTGTFPMGFATILTVSVPLVNEHYGVGGKTFLYVLWALWWVDVAVSFSCCWGILHMMKILHTHSLEAMTAIWLLPVVTLIVASSSGGVLASALHQFSPEHALITTAVSVFMNSAGFTLAMMILTVYHYRLVVHGIPPGLGAVSVFLPLGPTGQAGYSILLTGRFFRDYIPKLGSTSEFLGGQGIGHIVHAVCVCISFYLWALCTMWVLFAFLGIQHALRRGPIPFKVQVWGLVFPNGVYAIHTIGMAKTFDSAFLRILGSVYGAGVMLLWVCISAKTVQLVYTREIFQAPCLDAINMEKANGEEIELATLQEVSADRLDGSNQLLRTSSNCTAL
ncbi:hypothetical protein CYLTODRAFT_438308 [Cylindrobasidium torrendii FP15055 ss-10]|uniref:C4-dicarboxylate transporter/malic acid transport protein n=1 Tax=Cylindrobasidium torrendii FP15055 ss-10 TaxID=1314674 RepID=A0A0D7B1S0_9AGAR|nr:hypothetical protein CYLTODRAFT_438308 [Cylindrobasidium torrendii FP15055 ss-10]